MVKIRYSDLSAGLHVSVEKRGRATVINLLPGLTAEQRRAAIVRARSSGRMGLGPELPPVSLALAVATDRVRTTLRNGLAAMLAHPVLLLPPLILVVSSAIVFMVTSFVTVTVRPSQAVPSAPYGGRDGYHSHYLSHDQFGGLPGRRGPAAKPTPTPSSYSPVNLPPAQHASPSSAPSSPVPILTSQPPASPSPSVSPPSVSPSPAASCVKLGPLGLCVSL
jgi:hypothetical protein